MKDNKPKLYKFSEIEHRLHTLEPGKSYIKPFVTSAVSDTMCGGLNFLNEVSVPWELTCDEIIYCMEGTFRLTCDGVAYECNPGDVLYIPKDNSIAYECDEKCIIFYAAYPHDWKQQAGITFVPGIDPEDMPQNQNIIMSNSSSRLINLNQNNDTNADSGTPLPTRDTLKDKLNQQIIDLLELDGRLPFKEIANTLDISEGTVRNRVNRMKDAGVLQIKALVDRSAINYSTDSMLGIKVASNSSPSLVAQRLESCNEIVFIMWVTGRYDLLVEIASESDDTLSKFLEEHCFNNDDIKDVEVMKGLATFKNQFLLKSQEKI